MKEPGNYSRVSGDFGGQIATTHREVPIRIPPACYRRRTRKRKPRIGRSGAFITSLRANEAYRGIGVASGA